MTRMGARELIEVVTDNGSWQSWDAALPVMAAGDDYARELASARARTGLDESVLTGCALIRGHRVAILVCEFGFLGGSIGVAAGRRLATAVRRATAERLPVLVLPTSGGTRMQEGATAFLQMVRITAAINEHKAARLPYLVYLRHPTTGGVFASWGSLGHLTFAEPGALIGFLGPRVYEALYRSPFPPDVQTAENLYEHGIVDGVCPPDDLRDMVADVLAVASRQCTRSRHPAATDHADRRDIPAWTSVLATRQPDRPGALDVLDTAIRAVPLHGTGQGEADRAVIVALAQFGEASCVVLAQDRKAQAAGRLIGPAALRQARRGMRLAAELGLPLVTLVDTPGGELSATAEERGMAGEIARCIADLLALEVPTVSVLLGQGAGGAALALFPADRMLGTTHAWLSPLPPEGASAILYRTTEHAPEMAARQGIRAADLLAHGALDDIIAERPDARKEPAQFCHRVANAIADELWSLAGVAPASRLNRRIERFDRLTTESAVPMIAESA
ncbi:acetyl-CoA carboxylase carboxyltransferase subunit alpha/beta [Mycobacterium sp. 21AC1]|uniref:carboxyl transferase domain-containing protein n=1 Tax=[Mycobacterium] appelbergii TaxID=2939269 RepID=UPI0029392791|nr:carboxyl transferase domain-containing protein [Mycobacterium sp. 21AC1]MDV3125165.1 acetyl-CoA carboxylase carboxyltransferase subunit alpha/beta [Mycobacterium sp. 21AC1]